MKEKMKHKSAELSLASGQTTRICFGESTAAYVQSGSHIFHASTIVGESHKTAVIIVCRVRTLCQCGRAWRQPRRLVGLQKVMVDTKD